MINTLHITNYALISDLDISFNPGFNIITGETGAGKSIILGALSLLLGGRADLRAVRDSGRKSVIEAEFDISDAAGVAKLLADNELDSDGSPFCILRRELLPGGRSRAFVNDTPVNLQLLRDLAVRLVDIHSQHQNVLLTESSYQLSIIDNLASNHDLLEQYREAYHAYRRALKSFTQTREMLHRNRDNADFLSFQYTQLEELNLQPGEQEVLENERQLLLNVGEIKERLAAILDPLCNARDNALSLLSRAVSAFSNLPDSIADGGAGRDFPALAERLESARIEIQDIADTLVDYDLSIGADPERLDEVESRLDHIYSLEDKHHLETIDDLIRLQQQLKTQLEALEDSDTVLGRLETAARKAKKQAVALASEISQRRASSAAEFSAELRRRAIPLGMPNLRCEVMLTPTKLGPDGMDQIQFLFAFNKNQTLLPVGATASGGEISRLMLTIESIVAESMQLPCIIFDEIDTGVSGDIANRMAEMMEAISRRIQVITITHLPGVAAKGSTHFKVYKEDDEAATRTRIRRLDADERRAELALMISGNPSDSAALANAEALLSKNSHYGEQ